MSLITCLRCGREANKNKGATYCSTRCASRAWKERGAALGSPVSPLRGALHSATLGAMHELVVCADLLLNSWHVFRAQSPACPCDLVAMSKDQSRLLRVEVTTGQHTLNGVVYPKAKHEVTKWDVLAIVLPDGTIQYLPEIGNGGD